jgi:NADPH2:quinone reductase
VFQRLGNYPVPPGASDLPGLEVAGEIVDGDLTAARLQEGRQGLRAGAGRRLCRILRGAARAMPAGAERPEHALEAASLPETFFTVWSNVFDRAAPEPQAKPCWCRAAARASASPRSSWPSAIGHRVFATAGSDDKCRACESSAPSAASTTRPKISPPSSRNADQWPKGVDVMLDMVGGDYVKREIAAWPTTAASP